MASVDDINESIWNEGICHEIVKNDQIEETEI